MRSGSCPGAAQVQRTNSLRLDLQTQMEMSGSGPWMVLLFHSWVCCRERGLEFALSEFCCEKMKRAGKASEEARL